MLPRAVVEQVSKRFDKPFTMHTHGVTSPEIAGRSADAWQHHFNNGRQRD